MANSTLGFPKGEEFLMPLVMNRFPSKERKTLICVAFFPMSEETESGEIVGGSEKKAGSDEDA